MAKKLASKAAATTAKLKDKVLAAAQHPIEPPHDAHGHDPHHPYRHLSDRELLLENLVTSKRIEAKVSQNSDAIAAVGTSLDATTAAVNAAVAAITANGVPDPALAPAIASLQASAATLNTAVQALSALAATPPTA